MLRKARPLNNILGKEQKFLLGWFLDSCSPSPLRECESESDKNSALFLFFCKSNRFYATKSPAD
ncbi:MAG TPA: hypothetical protein PLJ62_05485, partial [Thermoflexales bacterium]|nr:hypothetical protein [Thermoflexales bacterium]